MVTWLLCMAMKLQEHLIPTNICLYVDKYITVLFLNGQTIYMVQNAKRCIKNIY